jgi:hypothetical protein
MCTVPARPAVRDHGGLARGRGARTVGGMDSVLELGVYQMRTTERDSLGFRTDIQKG